MKQAESKVRYAYAGLILATVLAVLGACEGGLTEASQGAEAPPAEEAPAGAPFIGEQEGDLVTVQVPLPKAVQNESSRSVDPGRIELLANYYEVLFKKDNTFYRGVGTDADGYVSVAVPVDTGYQVLLLAGYNQTLLAAGYIVVLLYNTEYICYSIMHGIR
jgi:hypothetical protein